MTPKSDSTLDSTCVKSIVLLTFSRSLLWLGAFITVLAIALDPFAQQLVQFEQHLSNAADTQTIVARAQRYSKGTELGTREDSIIPGVITMADYSMQSAISYGLVQQYDTVVQQTSFKCPSGNCTWSPFESLAVCSVCNNLTDQLTAYAAPYNLWYDLNGSLDLAAQPEFHNGTTIRLPNGLFINNLDGISYTTPAFSDGGYGNVYMTTLGTGNASKTNSLEDNDSLIWAMSILKLQESSNSSLVWPNIPVEAIECGLFYCIKQYSSIVQNGVLQEAETYVSTISRDSNSWQLIISNGHNYSGIILNANEVQSLEFNNITSADPRTDLMFGNGFNVSQAAIDSISNYFQNQFSNIPNLNYTYSMDGEQRPEDTSPTPVTLNGFYSNPLYSPSVMQVLFDSFNINETFRSLARSMSNALRAGADNSTVQSGGKGVMKTHYRIQWPWIALHALLVLAGIAFLAITIVKTKEARVPTWKSSSLAPLSCSTEIGDVLAGIESIEMMEEKASQHRVRLFGHEKYQRVGEEDTEPDSAGQCPKISSIENVKPLNLPQPSSGLQRTEAAHRVAEIRHETIRRKPVARGSL